MYININIAHFMLTSYIKLRTTEQRKHLNNTKTLNLRKRRIDLPFKMKKTQLCNMMKGLYR